MKHPSPAALELARRIAAGEAVDPEASTDIDDKLARGLARVADIARQCAGETSSGQSWGHLRHLSPAGSGSYGDVFRAYDPTLDRDVALKLKRVDASGLFVSGRDFVAEAQRLARVRHPNVLAVHGASYHRGRAGLWADWIDGETLRARMEREAPLPQAMLWRLAHELGAALAAVHAAGLTHGDVKPGNVMVDRQGRAVLMDFGASFHSDDSSAMVTGTPRYLAPEIERGERPSAAVDIFALGVLLFRAATGRYPEQRLALRGIRPRALRGLLRSMLADDAALRPSASLIVAAVERVHTAPLRRARWLALATAMVGLSAIAIIATLAYRRAEQQRAELQEALAGTERANRFLTDLLAYSSPDELGPTASLRDLLDVAPGLAAERFAEDAYGRGLMLSTLARIESGLANDERAAQLAHEAASAAALADPESGATLLAKSRALVLAAIAGNPDAALAEFEALHEQASRRTDYAVLRSRLLVQFAEIEHRAWLRDTRPELRQRESRHLSEALAHPEQLDAESEILALHRLGNMRVEQGVYAEGVAALRQALARGLTAHGANHPSTALTRRMLAWQLMQSQTTAPEAAALFRENMRRHANKVGPQGRSLIDDEFGLAQALALLGQYEEALPLVERSWSAAQSAYGEAHRTTMDAGLTYAAVLEGAGQFPAARQVLQDLRERIARLWSMDTRHYVLVTQQLAHLLVAMGLRAESAPLFEDCIARATRLLGAENPLVVSCKAAIEAPP